MLHGVEAECAQPESVLDCMVDLLVREVFQEPQHLHEFPLAPPSHAGLQQAAQCPVLLRQLSSLQRSGLVQGVRLPLQQGQVVDGVEGEVVLFIGAGCLAMTSAPQLITTWST